MFPESFSNFVCQQSAIFLFACHLSVCQVEADSLDNDIRKENAPSV